MVHRIVVLGGGVGGLATAVQTKHNIGKSATVTLIERKKTFQFPPSFPWVVMGRRKPAKVERSLERLRAKGIDVREAEVEALDLKGRSVRTSAGDVPYDRLVIALGAEYVPGSVPGFRERAQHMYDLESAIRMKRAVDSFRGGKILVGVSRLPFKCPAAPYEMAFLLEDLARRRGIHDRTVISLFTPEGNPMPAAGQENGGKVLQMLKERGISYYPKHKIREIGDGNVAFEEGEPLPFDLLVCVPPHQAPKPVVEAGLTDASGWVSVDPSTLSTKEPGVYAIGDVTSIATPHGYVPFLPKAGVFAHGQAKVVAHNLSVEFGGKGQPLAWDGWGACFLEVSRRKSAFISGNFLASPHPGLTLHAPSLWHHVKRVLLERSWMH